jgi:hypothetical protein
LGRLQLSLRAPGAVADELAGPDEVVAAQIGSPALIVRRQASRAAHSGIGAKFSALIDRELALQVGTLFA